jgi:ATP-binding cassette subfamily G (WHITE) protein 2 (PDR)
MLEIVNAGKNENGEEWFDVWSKSEEAQGVQKQIEELHESKKGEELDIAAETGGGEFAMPLTTQIAECTKRAFQQYWRMPSYVLAKFGLCTIAGLFIGFRYVPFPISLFFFERRRCTNFSAAFTKPTPPKPACKPSSFRSSC